MPQHSKGVNNMIESAEYIGWTHFNDRLLRPEYLLLAICCASENSANTVLREFGVDPLLLYKQLLHFVQTEGGIVPTPSSGPRRWSEEMTALSRRASELAEGWGGLNIMASHYLYCLSDYPGPIQKVWKLLGIDPAAIRKRVERVCIAQSANK